MLQQLMQFKEQPKLLDATDALAVAVCHYFQGGKVQKSFKSWGAFLIENPRRVK